MIYKICCLYHRLVQFYLKSWGANPRLVSKQQPMVVGNTRVRPQRVKIFIILTAK